MSSYCRDLIRKQDYNRYLLSFFVPRGNRDSLIALLALNVELEAIPTKTTEAPAAFIRLQWWSDQIDLIYKNKDHSPSPILDQLKTVIQTYDISQKLFEDLLNCYDEILRGTPRDPDDDLYALCGSILTNKKDKDRFSKILQHHDQLDDSVPFRAIRLWLGI